MKDGRGASFQDSLGISIRCHVDLKLDIIDLGLRRKMVFRSSWRDCREKLTTKGTLQRASSETSLQDAEDRTGS